jgi:hypothetical protein
MERFWPVLRVLSLIAAGSVFVHELRYLAAYGGGASQALAEQGHSYTPLLEAFVVLLVALALARFAISLLHARDGIVKERKPQRFLLLWSRATFALIAIYTLQEGFEGTFAPEHPSGVIGVFGHGGWTALVFCLVVGAAVAVVTGLAHQAIESVAARAAVRRRRRVPARLARPALSPSVGQRLDVLAAHLAGRAPPPSRA